MLHSQKPSFTHHVPVAYTAMDDETTYDDLINSYIRKYRFTTYIPDIVTMLEPLIPWDRLAIHARTVNLMRLEMASNPKKSW